MNNFSFSNNVSKSLCYRGIKIVGKMQIVTEKKNEAHFLNDQDILVNGLSYLRWKAKFIPRKYHLFIYSVNEDKSVFRVIQG